MRKFVFTVALSGAILALGCGGGSEESAKSTSGTPTDQPVVMASGDYTAVDVTNGGTIKGRVTFAGDVPKLQKLEVTKDVNVCGKTAHYKEDVLVSTDKGLANVVVSIANIDKGKAMSALGESFELDQNGCAFTPHVTLVPAGAVLTIFNSDGILHNIHTYSEANSPINKAQPGFKKKMTAKFSEPEIIRLACDVHNWMTGYIAVVDHPYHVVTDENGRFELSGVPAGTYTVEYWQETLGQKSMEVTVSEGADTDGSIEYTMGSN
ncbi:MAG: TonB-dependent receptor [bacterium]